MARTAVYVLEIDCPRIVRGPLLLAHHTNISVVLLEGVALLQTRRIRSFRIHCTGAVAEAPWAFSKGPWITPAQRKQLYDEDIDWSDVDWRERA